MSVDEEGRPRLYCRSCPDIDKTLDIWFRQASIKITSVTGLMPQTKDDLAKTLGHTDFKCSVDGCRSSTPRWPILLTCPAH